MMKSGLERTICCFGDVQAHSHLKIVTLSIAMCASTSYTKDDKVLKESVRGRNQSISPFNLHRPMLNTLTHSNVRVQHQLKHLNTLLRVPIPQPDLNILSAGLDEFTKTLHII